LLASYFEEEEELLRNLDEVRARIRETQDRISDSQKKYRTDITPSDFSSDLEENFIHDGDIAADIQVTPPPRLRRVQRMFRPRPPSSRVFRPRNPVDYRTGSTRTRRRRNRPVGIVYY
jgi:hypothetical protein